MLAAVSVIRYAKIAVYIKLFMTPVLEGDNTLGYMLVVMDKSDVKRLRSQLAAAFTMQIRR